MTTTTTRARRSRARRTGHRGACAALALTALVLAPACGDRPTPVEPTPRVDFAQSDLRPGTGTEAAIGSILTVHYTGWLYDQSRPSAKGLQFDSSAGGDPFSFLLGAGQVIVGWEAGLTGLRVGGLRRLVIPPELAYGGARTGPIPPWATLVFEIELLEVQ